MTANDTAFPNMVVWTQHRICRQNLSSNRFYLDVNGCSVDLKPGSVGPEL